ncbi:putative elongation of very long chain fatty acids protein 6-like [Apostichopus japonicus]|uniref:Elongation of very long chain fatty acids protein n=1 Tax=Stichopus japonicus TaxID=307972 RepID=A0A2G8LBQ4_STIJA|nr:putative elongation of very long chain fatty acids protein 6-like [Apostichopus japonicus]
MLLSAIERFASTYDEPALMDWLLRHWPKTVLISAIYIVLVFAGKRWMEKREKYNLKWLLTLWSASLAIFSIIGTWFTFERTYNDLQEHGFKYTVCDNTFLHTGQGFWLYVFSLSKIVELGDTFFIVARKQKLIFLHWFHHVATLVYTWYATGNLVAAGRYFSSVNFAVHSLMYSYFAIRASGLIRLPRQVNITITSLQLIQMFFGIYVNVYAYIEISNGRQCDNTWPSLYASFAMYASYVLLFANFFYQTYLVKSKPGPGKPHTNGVVKNGAVAQNGYRSGKKEI